MDDLQGLENYLKNMETPELLTLYKECEDSRKSQIVSPKSKIRKIAIDFFGNDDALHLTTVFSEVYRQVAIDVIATLQLRK